MAYWVIQALTAVLLLFGGLSNINTDKEIYGLANTFAHTGGKVFCFFLITHFLLRAPINFLRDKETNLFKITLSGIFLVMISAYLATNIAESSHDTFKPLAKKLAYYKANPDKDPLNESNEDAQPASDGDTSIVDDTSDSTQSDSSKGKSVSSEFKRGFKEGYKREHLKIREEQEKIAQGDPEAIERASSEQLRSQLGVFGFWLFFYMPLSALKRRFQVKTQLKQSQIALLMSQLNPHFLFNSLNSIRGMIFEDKQLAKELIDKLNELFRYNLTANKHPTVKLKEELRICEFYLDIEHIRLEERLLIEMHVDETCLNIKVPTMGILTLIENSIKHGIAPRQDQSLLIVDIAKQKNQLVVTVSNPIYTGTYKVESTGTGQENLIKRLQLMYNENASLNADFKDDKYIACLTLPI